MKNLRDSVVVLLLYFSVVLGIAQVEGFENNILNFQAAFFVMLAVTTVLGVFGPSRIHLSLYTYVIIWAIIYTLVWAFYWRFLANPRNIQELGVQFILVEIAAGLSYTVGLNIAQVDRLLEGLSAGTYPNRTMKIDDAAELIDTELTRSRRYNRPLSVLALEFKQADNVDGNIEAVQRDLLQRFRLAKIGQILSDNARQTDLILGDHSDNFILVCPETDYKAAVTLADRIHQAVQEKLNSRALWGSASFPNEALTFEDLLNTARERISRSNTKPEIAHPLVEVGDPKEQV